MIEHPEAVKRHLDAMNAASADREQVCPACSGKNESGKFCGRCGSTNP